VDVLADKVAASPDNLPAVFKRYKHERDLRTAVENLHSEADRTLANRSSPISVYEHTAYSKP